MVSASSRFFATDRTGKHGNAVKSPASYWCVCSPFAKSFYIYSIQVTCSHSPNDVGFEAGSNNQWKVGYNFPISMKICKSLDYNINYRVFKHLSARPGEWSKSNQKPHNQKCLSKVKPFEHGHFAQPSYIYTLLYIHILYTIYTLLYINTLYITYK